MRFTKKESSEIADEFVKMRAAVAMAENRLEAALLGGDICKHCVELAQSYLQEVLGHTPQETTDHG